MRFSGWHHTNISDRLHGSSVWPPLWCVQGQTVLLNVCSHWNMKDDRTWRTSWTWNEDICVFLLCCDSDVLLTWKRGHVFYGRCLQVSQRRPVKKSHWIKPVNFCSESHVEGGVQGRSQRVGFFTSCRWRAWPQFICQSRLANQHTSVWFKH